MKLIASAAAALMTVATAVQAAPPDAKYGLAFEDTFNQGSVDKAVWNFRTDTKRFSTEAPDNAVVSDGQLNLHTKRKPNGKRPVWWTGGGLVSKQEFGYGYYEVEAKTTSSKGWHSAFWMVSGDGSTTLHFGRNLEIDAFEIDSQYPWTMKSGIVVWDPTKDGLWDSVLAIPRCPWFQKQFDSSADRHTYGANWREGYVDFYVDGKRHCTIAYPTDKYRQDPVNIWLTNIGYDLPITTDGTPQVFDNIRFYKRDQYVYSKDSGKFAVAGPDWGTSAVEGFGKMAQQQSCSAGASATFTPFFQQAGEYRAYIWKSAQADGDNAGQVTVTSRGGSQTKTVDFTSGTSGWVDLGVYSFDADSNDSPARNGAVTSTRGTGCTRASAVKFVRI